MTRRVSRHIRLLPASAMMRLLDAWRSTTELGCAHPVCRTAQIDVRHSSDHPTGNSIKPAPK